MEKEEKQEVSVETEEKVDEGNSKKKLRRKRFFRGVLCGFLVVALFVGGALTGLLSVDKEIRNLAKIKNQVQKSYYEEIDDSTFYKAVYDGVEGLLDEYSYYLSVDEYAAMMEDSRGAMSGIGLVFQTLDEKGNPQLLIKRVCGNSPAEGAGILSGWRVTGFGPANGEIKESVVFAELQSFLAEYAANETFWLQVLTTEGKTLEVELQKKNYVENYVFYRTNTEAYCFKGEHANELTKRGAPLTCLDDDTAYIRLVEFNGSAVSAFKQAIDLLHAQGKKNLVLDLRGNGGGSMDILQEIAAYLCKKAERNNPVIATADYGEKREEFKASGNYYSQYFTENSRICVLADGDSASASECLLGAMLDYQTIGYADICLSGNTDTAKTFGKGIMQTTYVYPAGDAIKLTTATVHWPVTNTCIHGRGVLASDGTKTVQKQDIDDAEIALAIEKLFS